MNEETRSADSGYRGKSRRNAAQNTAAVAEPAAVGVTSSATSRESRSERSFVDRVRDRAGAQLTTQKDRATDGIGTIAQAVRTATRDLREEKHDTIAEYVERAADQLERLSAGLRERNVGELLRDAQNLARRRPVIFVGSAFALGLLGARFLKSSPPERDRTQPLWQRSGDFSSSASESMRRTNPRSNLERENL